jgi:malonyl CoA-acyl carrier protein transacylase
MSLEALARLIRVATIIAQDARNRDNQARAKEILALAEIIKKELKDG